MRDLRDLPKGHLHLHLDGAMRPDTMRELAAKAGLEVPEITAYGSFAAFSATMDIAMPYFMDGVPRRPEVPVGSRD
jgi:adenosine deaminase